MWTYRDYSSCVSGLLAVAVLLCLASAASPVLAQDATPGVRKWTEPLNVSQSLTNSSDPTMVADRMGAVHLFWSEVTGEETNQAANQTHGDTIMYSRWDDGRWSTPNDVLVSPDGGDVWQPVSAVDEFGRLHLIWTSSTGTLFYSHAEVEQASSAQSWAAPTQLYAGLPTFVLPAGLALDSQGVVHVIATSRDLGQEVIHMASFDGGLTWAAVTSLSTEMPGLPSGSLVSGGIAMHIDSRDNIHAGWSMYNTDGFGVIVYYTQSNDGGTTWTVPFVVGEKAEDDYEADWLNIATGDEKQTLLVWTGIGRPPGRTYRFSDDEGRTWSPVTPFMEGLVGETESPRMVTDSAGTVHLFTPARTTTADSGVRYSYWLGDNWSAPTKIPGPPPDPGAYPALRLTAAMNLGNQIWVAWYDEPRGEIFVVSGESGASEDASESFVPLPQREEPVVVTRPTDLSIPTPTPILSAAAIRTDFATDPPSGFQARTSTMALIIGVLSAAGVVLVFVVAIVSTKRRRA